MQLLKILLVSTSLFIFSCATPTPLKPNVNFCTTDIPAMQVGCAKTGIENPPVVRRPLKEFDKHILFSPIDYEKIKNYQDELHSYIKRVCK